MSKFIWIDPNISNEENSGYVDNIEKNNNIKLKLFKNINEAICYMKKLEFEETKVIISGRLYIDFVKTFKENLIDMCIAPKIIIFTSNEKRFLDRNKEYPNVDNFYHLGGIATIEDEIIEFLTNNEIKNIKKIDSKNIQETYESKLIFEYIDCKEKLILPLIFQSLIHNNLSENLEKYNNYIYNTYSKDSEEIKQLFEQILPFQNIPVEIISKYYARLYSIDSNFFKDLNRDLRLSKIENHLSYIKTFYEGVKLKSLKLANDKELYRCSKLSIDEINKLLNYLMKKKNNLPGSIVFSKSFLSFSKQKKKAERFYQQISKNKNYVKVLFILAKDDNIGNSLSTHADLGKLSYYKNEEEVLFFPFSSFEVKSLNPKKIEKEDGYEIKLLYLGKYMKKIEEDININNEHNKIPHSEFENAISDFGLIKKETIEHISIKEAFISHKKSEKEIKNIIIGEINIGYEDVNQDIQILNSFENVKRINHYNDNDDDSKFENEKELQENTEIRIDGKKIDFSYLYQFEEEKKYKIEFSFKHNLSKTNHMFCGCSKYTNLNLSNFNTQKINNMCAMFNGCISLIYLDLSNFITHNVTNVSIMFQLCYSLEYLDISSFNTQNVINMSNMFNNCESLKDLNITNFFTQNVTNMLSMFSGCKSLTNLNISNFNTEKVKDMSYMFHCCKSLLNLDLSNFNTKNVNNMSCMFNGCDSLINLDISNFNTQNVIDMSCLFSDCKKLDKINLLNFNTTNVKDMRNMFYECESLKNINLSNFDTKNVANMNSMFYGCNSLIDLNLSNFNTKSVTNMLNIFSLCDNLKKESVVTKDIKIWKEFNEKQF